MERVSGKFESGAELTRQAIETGESGRRDLNRLRFDQSLELAVEGFLLTREFMLFRLGGDVGLRQERIDVSGAPKLGRANERPFGYDVLLNLLPTKPVSLLGFGTRTESRLIQNFGTDTDSESTVLGSTLSLRLPLFRSSLSWEKRDTESRTRGALVPSRRAETRRLLQYAGNHLSETTQLSLRLRDEDVEDASLPAVGDYRLREADGAFGYRWGDYFEKSWRTTARYFERKGRFNFDNASTSSAFLWDPSDALHTRLQYDFDLFDTSGQRTVANRAFLSLEHQLYESLHTSLGLSMDRSSQPSSRRVAYGGEISLGYRKRLPLASRLFVDLNLRERIEDVRADGGPGLVRGEELAITDLTANDLASLRVDPGSIEVFESLGGALLVEGIDYRVDRLGDRTSIDPLPGGALSVGDTVVVNYSFVSDPSANTETRAWGTGVGWEIGWVSLRYEHEVRSERLLEGESGSGLADAHRDSVRLDLRGARDPFRLDATALYLVDRSGTLAFDELSFGQGLSWRPSRRLTLSLRGAESFRAFLEPQRDTQTQRASLSAIWRPRETWTMRGSAELQHLSDTDSLDQTDLRLGARAELAFGKVELIPSLTWTQRKRGPSQTREIRALLRIRRSF